MDLQELRAQIDDIDAQLLLLLQQRLVLSEAIGEVKAAQGLPVLDEQRQEEKLDELCKLAAPKDREAVRCLFSELMAISCARQEGML